MFHILALDTLKKGRHILPLTSMLEDLKGYKLNINVESAEKYLTVQTGSNKGLTSCHIEP